MKNAIAVGIAIAFVAAVITVSSAHAQTVSPAPSKDTANSSAKVAPKTDEGTGANPSQKKTP